MSMLNAPRLWFPADAEGGLRSTPLVATKLLIAQEMQDCVVEESRVLQEREMARVGQDKQSGAGERCGDVFRVLALDRLVVVAIHHCHRGGDRLELRVRPVRLARPHFADLLDKR